MRWSRRALCWAALAATWPAAQAETYPSKPVTVVVPQAPGSTNDAVGRIPAHKLTERLGQTFIVDNRAGAGGNIGTATAAKDGYTLLLTISSTQAINPALYKSTGFDPAAIGEVVLGFAGDLWVGLFAVAGTPAPIVERLANGVATITASADVAEKFGAIGAEPLRGGPAQLATMVKEDLAR